MSTLAKLLARVKAAKGPSRKLDADIAWEFAGPDRFEDDGERFLPLYEDGPDKPFTGGIGVEGGEAFTGSIDAAVALAEREFPDWFWSIGFLDGESRTQDHHLHGALLFPHFHVADPRDGLGHGATPALALVAAVLAAKIAGGAQ